MSLTSAPERRRLVTGKNDDVPPKPTNSRILPGGPNFRLCAYMKKHMEHLETIQNGVHLKSVTAGDMTKALRKHRNYMELKAAIRAGTCMRYKTKKAAPLREKPKGSSPKRLNLKKGASIDILETKVRTNGSIWGKTPGGWFKLCDDKMSKKQRFNVALPGKRRSKSPSS